MKSAYLLNLNWRTCDMNFSDGKIKLLPIQPLGRHHLSVAKFKPIPPKDGVNHAVPEISRHIIPPLNNTS
jgi:hypothetical protein